MQKLNSFSLFSVILRARLSAGRFLSEWLLFFTVILRARLPAGRRSLKDPIDFSNNQQSLLCVGFFPACRQAGLTLRMTAVFLLSSWRRSLKDPTAFSIVRYHCFFSVILNLPTGRQAQPARRRRVKDSSSFSNKNLSRSNENTNIFSFYLK